MNLQQKIEDYIHGAENSDIAPMEGVWVIDDKGLTTYINEGASEILGYKPNEMMGRSMYDFMDKEMQDRAVINVDRRKTGLRERHDFRWLHKSGRSVWTMLGTLPVFDKDGKYQGAVATISDITDRKNHEMALAKELETTNLALGMASHELKAPITLLRLRLELLRNAPSKEATVSQVNASLEQIDRLTAMVNSLLDSTRIMLGKLELTKEVHELNGVINNIVDEYRGMVDRCPVNFTPSDEPVKSSIDLLRIRQVLTNLIGNAKKYACVAPIEVKVTRKDGSARITVCDHGPGIPVDKKDHIFNQFYQVKEGSNGLGLGLYISKELTEAHGGHLVLTDVEGGGSEFIIDLPIAA